MNKRIIIVLVLFLGSLLYLASCKPKDNQPPKIYLLDSNGRTLKSNQNDTTVWLFSEYKDPGVIVEDNVSKASEIIIENNIDNVLSFTKSGFLNATRNPAIITYTATDKKGNTNSLEKKVFVKNISEFLEGKYNTKRAATQHVSASEYMSNINADTKVPGRIRFSKVYLHKSGEKDIYYRVMADLYKKGNVGSQPSKDIAFMGGSDPKIAFFNGMTKEEGLEAIKEYDLLFIHAQDYHEETDGSGEGSNTVYISGTLDSNGLPLSKIVYIEDTNTIEKIVLALNITKNNVVDKVVEVYIPE